MTSSFEILSFFIEITAVFNKFYGKNTFTWAVNTAVKCSRTKYFSQKMLTIQGGSPLKTDLRSNLSCMTKAKSLISIQVIIMEGNMQMSASHDKKTHKKHPCKR